MSGVPGKITIFIWFVWIIYSVFQCIKLVVVNHTSLLLIINILIKNADGLTNAPEIRVSVLNN